MISTTVFLVLDFLIVCLRLVAKLKTTRGFAADDVWMLGALAVLIAWTAIIMESTCPRPSLDLRSSPILTA